MTDPWPALLAAVRDGDPSALPALSPDDALAAIARLAVPPSHRADGMVLVGQAGQSLCGHIATVSGHSHYINGPEALAHLHRLRAVSDAVVVGWRTVADDRPSLTTRHVPGPSPVRVVVDAHGRLGPDTPLFREESGPPVLVLTDPTRAGDPIGAAATRPVAVGQGGRPTPEGIRAALAREGFRRVLVEGGATLLSALLAGGALDRLHVMVAPLIIGSGRPGLRLPEIERLDTALRPPTAISRLGSDVLFDLDFSQAGPSDGA